MNVLIACEESQRVCIEMRRLGHNAFSCDIQPCSGGHPEWHILGDCLPLINGNCQFMDMAGGDTPDRRAVGSAHRAPAMHVSDRLREQIL